MLSIMVPAYNEELYIQSLMSILSIKIKQYGLRLSLYKYGNLGEISVIQNYIHE